MKKLLSLAFVIVVASPVLSSEVPPYDFIVNVTPSRGGRYVVRVAVHGPEGVFTVGAEMLADEVHTVTSDRGDRTLTFVVRVNAGGSGTADLEVKEKGAVVAASKKIFEPAAPPNDGKYLRVGGDVRPPVVIQRAEPVYSPEARAARVSGIVIVEARISETGNVDDVRILKPLPFGLDQAAAEAVRQWKFRPGVKDGIAIPVVFNLTVNFRLEKIE